jgi:16S rRNA (adenine1518-N6/adenine1519-N6)-dimethyltransferase
MIHGVKAYTIKALGQKVNLEAGPLGKTMPIYRDRKRRVLGQHFLRSAGVLQKIVEVIDPRPDTLIIEIGPGRGALTFPLAEKAGKVVAIEKDAAMAARLGEKAVSRLAVLEGDILDCDFAALRTRHGGSFPRAVLAGNLPYSISTPLLFKILEEPAPFERCIFLVQKEVAERITAGPGTKDYAPLSILLQLRFSAEIRFPVHPGSFSPPPKVESALVSLERRPAPLFGISDERRFAEFLRGAFRQRRKTLANNLLASGRTAAAIERACRAAEIDPRARPEQVPIAGFAALFAAFSSPP